MTEILEHFGTPCSLPEPNIVGNCQACGDEMYDYEVFICECGEEVHKDCIVECAHCGHKGCKACMKYDPDSGEYLCGEECENQSK